VGPDAARRTLESVLPVIKYMLARVVLFVLAVTLLGVLGASRELALVGGLLISALLAYVLLGRLRDASTVVIVDRVQGRAARRRAARVDEDALYEDALIDAETGAAGTDDAAAREVATHDARARDDGANDIGTHDAGTHDAGAHHDGELTLSAHEVPQEPVRRPGR